MSELKGPCIFNLETKSRWKNLLEARPTVDFAMDGNFHVLVMGAD